MKPLSRAAFAVALVGFVPPAYAAPAAAGPAAPAPAAAPAASAAPPPASKAAPPAPKAAAPLVAPPDTDSRMDSGLEHANSKDYKEAARIFYGIYAALPESDSRRDVASFHLGEALVASGFAQAGIEHYLDVLAGRRSPEFMAKSLDNLKRLFEEHLVDEGRFVGDTIYGNSYSEASPDATDFVEYLQALTDIRRGFDDWGRKRMVALSQGSRPYAFYARYALAVDRLARHDDDHAAHDFRDIVVSTGAVPSEVRNEGRLALARILYERKAYGEAWRLYSQIESTLPFQDLIMLEKAWDRTAGGDQQRALGLLVGLGAPVFHNVFAPERDLIRAMALRKLCQYRAAHTAVHDFRTSFGTILSRIRDRAPLANDPEVRRWAIAGTKPLERKQHMRDALARERADLSSVKDKALRDHLDAIYATNLANLDGEIGREIGDAIDHVADELLRIDEQMSLIDYEIGAGLFTSSDKAGTQRGMRPEEVPLGSHLVYFKFDGEYWTDEVREYTVLAEDRCLR